MSRRLMDVEEDILNGLKKSVSEYMIDWRSPEIRIVRRQHPQQEAAAGAQAAAAGGAHSQVIKIWGF